jgi:hypothetical protein
MCCELLRLRKLRAWAADGLLGVYIGLLPAGLGAQSFQGGLRATVTLVNDQNGVCLSARCFPGSRQADIIGWL